MPNFDEADVLQWVVEMIEELNLFGKNPSQDAINLVKYISNVRAYGKDYEWLKGMDEKHYKALNDVKENIPRTELENYLNVPEMSNLLQDVLANFDELEYGLGVHL